MTIYIKNWAKHQHFKDRTPPWIKLYREILEDPDWHELDGDAAKTLVGLWLIASEDEGKTGALPSLKKMAFRLRVNESQLKQTLIKLSEWLILDDDAVITERYHGDAPERETETKLEKEEEKATVQPAAAPRRSAKDVPYSDDFERFWASYPAKQKKQEAMNSWAKQGLEGESDWLIAHVQMMKAQDDNWRRGYVPMGATYLNQKRWEDVPRPAPRHQLSKSAQGLIALQEMGNGLDGSGSQNGFPEIDLPRLGSPARFGAFGRNGNGVGGGS